MKPIRWLAFACAALTLASSGIAAAQSTSPGSIAFCLYEIPHDESGRRRFINLGIVQYVEISRSEVKIAYGGGGLGSGHDVKVNVASMDEALAFLDKMRRAAAVCR